MSPLASTTSRPSGGPYRKPRADVYTFMLIVALAALILGILCLCFEMKRFDWVFKDREVPMPRGFIVSVLSSDEVLVSRGSDDGLGRGTLLRVIPADDDSVLLGRIKVERVDPKDGILECSIIRDEQQGTMRRGDRVVPDTKEE